MPDRGLIPLPLHSAEARSTYASRQRLLNLYAERNPEGSKGSFTLYSTPGLKPWTTVGDGPIRGMHIMNGVLYVVTGTELYTVDRFKTSTLVGTVEGAGNVHMIDNGTNVAIATTTKAYYADATSIAELPESKLNGAAYQDGYGIFTQEDTQFVWIAGPDDLTTIAGTDFTSADAFTDYVVGCISDHRELWVFKERSVEIYYNSGDATFPFTRAQPGFIERGCASPFSIAKANNSVFWLGDDYRVYMAPGYQHQAISTPWIDKRILDATRQDIARAFTYSQDGHHWYVLSFPELTAVYDVTENRWHERESPGETRWRANGYAYFNNLHLAGDFETSDIYEIDVDTHTDNGTARDYEIVCPVLQQDKRRFCVSEVHLDMEMGIGTDWADWDGTTISVAGVSTDWLEGEDPQMFIDWSDDGGKTWSTKVAGSAGTLGDYDAQLSWNALGAARQRMFRFSMNSPTKLAIMGAYARLEVWD